MMTSKIKFSLSVCGAFLTASMHAIAALPGESLVLDPVSGDYAITYYDYPSSPHKARLRQAVFVPATKIDPLIKSIFRNRENDLILYSYLITNGIKSRQTLIAMLFDPVSDVVSPMPLPKRSSDIDSKNIENIYAAGVNSLSTPINWIGRSTTSRAGGLRVGWSFGELVNISDGLAVGKTQAGFGFASKDLPGIVLAQFRGNAPVAMFPNEGPQGELANELDSIERNNFIARPAAIPSIIVPVPFDAAVLLGRIQTHVQTWVGMRLLDASLAAQLDRYLVAAADAYRYNQPKVGKEHIETLRKMLKKDHQDLEREEEHESGYSQEKDHGRKSALIDRLAARVLDFDLKYVLKRMGEKD